MNHMKNQFTRMNLDFPKLHIRKKTQPLCTTCCVLSHFWLHNMKHYLICTNINMHKFDVFRTEIRTSKKKKKLKMMLWDCEVCFTRKHYCILSSSFFFYFNVLPIISLFVEVTVSKWTLFLQHLFSKFYFIYFFTVHVV